MVAAAPTITSDAADESFKLILRAAQKTAEQAIGDARLRGEEIIAEAKYRAAEINRDSDRKAFEAASRTQEDLVRLEDELKRRRIELDSVRRAIEAEKEAVRDMANSLLTAIGDKEEEVDMAPSNGAAPAPVVDLTNVPAPAAAPLPRWPMPHRLRHLRPPRLRQLRRASSSSSRSGTKADGDHP